MEEIRSSEMECPVATTQGLEKSTGNAMEKTAPYRSKSER
jgi:hypothetical protein